MRRFLAFFVFLLFACRVVGEPRIRISGWYWLNSAPRESWQGDFITMKNLGFTHVLMCWGLDLVGIVTRTNDTTQAMRLAHEAGLGIYLIVWQPSANSLPRDPEFLQVDSNGRRLNTLDVFNPKWRSTQWKTFLRQIATTYSPQPGFSGYVFDDSFGSANVSYGDYEEKAFGSPLPRKPGDARWDEWTKTREGWWEDWAKDTVNGIRSIDADTNHIIYLEDTIGRITNPKQQASIGLDFNRVARHFDAVGGYTTPTWSTNIDSDRKVLELTENAIRSVRKMVGPEKKLIYTFWSANIAEERKPGPAVFPTAAQIRAVSDAALALGIRHLDMYGYRIGEYRVSREEMARMMPPEPAPYVLTGQFPQKFIWDRPQIQGELGSYLRSLNAQ
jgi:hypothetical protein